ncbi:hypothetical protein KI387_022929 [Taxus chinensis]|uniref:Seipin n=1 Tax=Taxus chinensis TaxID=29808 RepID=A0AA38LB68_TAXCH|nr:hypothetical protein KI387_022929 [Taxus chinensis]
MADKNCSTEASGDAEEIFGEKSSVVDDPGDAHSQSERDPREPLFHLNNALKRRRRRKTSVSRPLEETNGFLSVTQISANSVGSVEDENESGGGVIEADPVIIEKEADGLQSVRDGDKDENITDSMPMPSSTSTQSDSLLFWLGGIVIQAVGFQVGFMLHVLSLPIYLIRQGYYLPPSFSIVKEKLSSVIDIALQGPSHLQPSIWRTIRRIGWGCFWSWYVGSILILLILASFGLSFLVMHSLVEEPVHIKEALYFDYTKPHPVASMPLQFCSTIPISEDNLVSRKEWGQKNVVLQRLIPANHRLEVAIDLTLPESDYNTKLGIFQVKVELLSVEGNIIGTSSHPCMMRFKSPLIRFAETFIWSAPFLAGFTSESQTLHLHMMEFTENMIPTACLRVTLERRAEFPPGAGIPEIYSAELFLNSELPWLKRMIWRWKWTLFIWVGMGSFGMEILVLLCCCRPIFFPRIHGRGIFRDERDQN